MCDIPTDVPWDVGWNREFEAAVEERKESGSFESYKNQIIAIVENPVREGRYKDHNLKGLKTVHVSGQTQEIICFELTPGINTRSQRESIDEVYFHFIGSWDNYGSALTRRNPVDQEYRFEIQIPYLDEGYDVEALLHDIFDLASGLGGLKINDTNWEPDYLEVAGEAEPDIRGEFEGFLPERVEVQYEDPSPF